MPRFFGRLSFALFSLTCVSFVAAQASQPGGDDWPSYRGPARTGAVAARNWSSVGKEQPLWGKNVGRGYSCPSIVDGRLVTMGFDEAAGLDRVLCLDAKSGAEHWRFEFAATDKPQYHGGGTLTTAEIVDGQVYCLNRQGKFHVFELATGKVVWNRDYGKELKLARTFHGFCASPLVDGDRVFVQFGGVAAALSRANGDVLWQSKDRGDMAYSNLALLTARGRPAVAAVLGAALYVFARSDGEVLHTYPWRLKGNAVHCATPLVLSGDRLFLSTAYNKGCAMLKLGDEETPAKVWANRYMRNKVTACVLRDGHLFGFDESMLRCVDTDGKSKWRKRGLGLGALTLAGDRLLVMSSDGELIVAEASPEEYRELSRRKVLDGGVYWTMPVIVDGLIYVRNSLGDLRCLDHRLAAAASPEATPAPAPGVVPVADDLFTAHAQRVQADRFERSGKALRLRGTWAISLRGLPPEPMTLTLVAPDRWLLDLDEGGLTYALDRGLAWAIEPQGPRLIEGEELAEHQLLFPLRELFAPSCPKSEPEQPVQPVRFAETDCWRVRSRSGAATGSAARWRDFYFAVDDGRFVGSEGTGLSTIVLHGSQEIGGLTLPERITRFRAEDGQEHVLELEAAEWIDPPAGLFERPKGIVRLMRTPADITRDTEALKKQFAAALGARFQDQKKKTPFGDAILALRVHDGDLWLALPKSELRVAVESGKDGKYKVDGIPVRIALEVDSDGRVTGLVFGGPGGETVFVRLQD